MKYLPYILSICIILSIPTTTWALSTFATVQGGTGTSSPSGILYGDNSATSHLNTVTIGNNLTFTGGVLSATGGSSFSYPFPSNATSTLLSFSGGITAANPVTLSSLTAGTVNSSASGLLYNTATSSITFSSPLTISGTLGALIGGTNSTIACQTASGSQAGCLASADWTTFNNKQSALTFSTGLLNTSGTITNTGVLSNIAGSGIGVSGPTGNVTISNTGVTSIVAGTNVTISGATGAVTINSSGGGSGTVSTSSSETANEFPFWTTNSGTPALLSGTSNLYNSGGLIGVGTSSPLSTLSIQNSTYNAAGLSFVISSSSGSSAKNDFAVRNDGTTYIGANAQTGSGFALYANASGSYLGIGQVGSFSGGPYYRFIVENSGVNVADGDGYGWSSSETTGADTLVSRFAAGTVEVSTGQSAPNGKLVLGYLGIGTTSPLALLDVTATSTTGVGSPLNLFTIASTTGGTSTSTLLDFNNIGHLGIGSSSPFSVLSLDIASSSAGTPTTNSIGFAMRMLIGGTQYIVQTFDIWGHYITSGPAPTVAGGTSSVSGNDNNGTITVTGTALTSVTLTFAHPWNAAPDCTESDNSTALTADITSISTTQVVFGFSAGVSSGTVWYSCKGHQ